jgi:hypothetical protein
MWTFFFCHFVYIQFFGKRTLLHKDSVIQREARSSKQTKKFDVLLKRKYFYFGKTQ